MLQVTCAVPVLKPDLTLINLSITCQERSGKSRRSKKRSVVQLLQRRSSGVQEADKVVQKLMKAKVTVITGFYPKRNLMNSIQEERP